MQDSSRSLTILRRMKSMGVMIAMDDFGTGYSSMSYLQSFPFDKIKIDQSFIRQVETQPAVRRHRPRGHRPRTQPGHARHRRRSRDGGTAGLPVGAGIAMKFKAILSAVRCRSKIIPILSARRKVSKVSARKNCEKVHDSDPIAILLLSRQGKGIIPLPLNVATAFRRSWAVRRYEAYPVDSGSPTCSVLIGGNRAATRTLFDGRRSFACPIPEGLS